MQGFPESISAGYAGEMKYMEARDDHGVLKRSSLARVAPWARSVVVCAINYNTDHPCSTQVTIQTGDGFLAMPGVARITTMRFFAA